MGPADVPHEGGDDEAHVEVTGQDDHVEEAALSPQGHRSVDYKTSKCEDRRWTSSSRGGSELKNIVCLELPDKLQFFKTSCPSVPRIHAAFRTAVSAFERGDDYVKNYLCSGNVHTRVQQPVSRQLN